jgi:hypothetical protein
MPRIAGGTGAHSKMGGKLIEQGIAIDLVFSPSARLT